MKTVTVRELRNQYTGLLKWLEAGEEVRITRWGKPIARLVPDSDSESKKVDWNDSRVLRRKRDEVPVLSPEQSLAAVHDGAGKW